MVRTNAPMIERMTLVWHDWFATSNLGVASQRLMLDQNEMFRGNALGSFKDILLNVTQDPAMLVWLNGNQNVKGKPNENYGREMMELFTLGANRGAYTETDVRENARALTGWQGSVVNRQPTAFTFNAARHDTGHEDDLRPHRQLRLAGLVPALPRPPAAPVVLRHEAVELLRPDDAGRGDGAGDCRRSTRTGRSCPVVEAILTHPDFYNGPRMVKPPVVLNAGLLRMTRPLHRHVDLVVARPRRPASSSSTRPTSAAGTTRAGSTPPPSARAGSSPPSCRAPATPTDTPERPGEDPRSARSQFWGNPTVTPTTQRLLQSFAKAQLKRSARLGDVETALRRLVASSPDLQTAEHELLRLQPRRPLPQGGRAGREGPAGDRAGHADSRRHRADAPRVRLAQRRARARGLRRLAR